MSRDTQKPAGQAADPATETTLSKSYDPHALEARIYQAWEQSGYFKAAGKGRAYCIMLPPPNVTGVLHMGHAFNQTIMDGLIRYHRMKGDNTLWQPGTDHAGIATQMVVERQLAAEGKSRHDLGREMFLKRVWKWKEQSGGAITQQSRRMGASMDWSRERFTMDEGLSKAVTEVFVRLHEEGLIYRGQRLVNWDPVLHTAVSDLEVVAEEESGHLWHIRYPIVGSKDHLVVATTRPETMLGDSALAVHPDDERYQKLIGKQVELPLTGRKIPVVADTYVEKDFGSGVVKITPGHDFNDYEVGKRHNLPIINILSQDASIQLPGSKYHGLDRYAARKAIVADLEAQGLLELVKDHKLMVPRGDRTNAVIEPYLTDQWYVKTAPLAKEAIKVVEDGRIKFVPENWSKTYYEWMHNIQDWCISRQIWWGHRIPAWYDAEHNFVVARDEKEARAKYKKIYGKDAPLTQDNDVLDTWFSSALWPFSTLGWPTKTPELKTFYPTNVLVTGFDIIFFWVARMIMMGMKFTGDVPFKHVYIHGLIRDAHGQKMSKSKGNVLDPLDLIDGIDLESLVKKRTTGLMRPQDAPKIEKATRKEYPDGIPAHGADALRYTFASLATLGRDIKFDLGRIDGYRNFCNKLWNAARYVLMNTEGRDCGTGIPEPTISPNSPSTVPPSPLAGEGQGERGAIQPSSTKSGKGYVPPHGGDLDLNAADRWIRARLNHAILETEKGFNDYRFDLAAQAIYNFAWHEYCDWYVELSKVVLNNPNSTPEQLRGTRYTLVNVLETLLRLAHPLMPFITEEIWQRVAPLAGKSLSIPLSPGGRGTKGEGDQISVISIMMQRYPEARPTTTDDPAAEEMQWVMAVISAIRTIRSERDISPAKHLPVLLAEGTDRENDWMMRNEPYFKLLARTESLTWVEAGATAPESAMELVGRMKVLVPLGSLIDKKAELERIKKEIEKCQKDLEKARGNLANENFVARAPETVVEQEKTRVQQFEQALAKLQVQQRQVDALPG